MRRPLLAALGLLAVLTGCSPDPGPDTAAPERTATSGRASGESPKASASREAAVGDRAGTLLVADFGADTVTFVDPDRGATGSVRVGTAPYGLVVGSDGRAWVATAQGVAVVDTDKRERLALIPYTTDTGPVTTGEYRGGGMGIALSDDGGHVYVGVNVPGGRGTLEVVDTEAYDVVDTAPVGRRPFDVDVSPDGRTVYTTDHDSFSVTAVDTRTMRPRTFEVAPYGTEGGLGSWLKPHYAAVRPSDGRLLLPFEGERLAVLDPDSGDVSVERMTADTHQHGVTATPDGTLYVVGTGPIDPSEDRGPSLTVRAPSGDERVIPLEGPHESVAVSLDGGTAYVGGGFTRDGYWDGVTVVDLESGGTRRVEAGSRPLGIAVLPR
ncbi:YncE family protein [Streptomyces sp. NPDC060194]|uniref:YncE family protein n=1 Tax=Streptomyces sp. NPDC060194 TaxID=3347069 RepID=UPI00365B1911